MAVSEQTPYQEFIANGTTTVFPLNFDAKEQDHLIVLVDDVEPQVGEWSFDFNTDQVTFSKAPKANSVIKIRRDTPLKRDSNYQTYNNSFRPEPVNEDLDSIWYKLQEMGVLNWMINNDIKDLGAYVDSLNDETKAAFLAMIEKQGVSLNQLDTYVNNLYKKLANIAVEKGWLAEFIATKNGGNQQQVNDHFDLLNSIYNPLPYHYTGADLQKSFTNKLNILITSLSETGGGTITIPDGTFILDEAAPTIYMKSNVHVTTGKGTVIKCPNSKKYGYDIVNFTDVEDASFELKGKIIGCKNITLAPNNTIYKMWQPNTIYNQGDYIVVSRAAVLVTNSGTSGQIRPLFTYTSGRMDLNKSYTDGTLTYKTIEDTGEWGFGFSMRGCKDIKLDLGKVQDCWGDGIYIGKSSKKAYCENITINNAKLSKHRRQGISVISVRGLTINDPYIEGTDGTSPMDAIDFEPNGNDEVLENIVINRPVTKNNSGIGIKFYLRMWTTNHNVDVTINDYQSDGDFAALGVYYSGKSVKTSITCKNLVSKNSQRSIVDIYESDANNTNLVFERPIFELPEAHNNVFFIRQYDAPDYVAGGFHIIEPRITKKGSIGTENIELISIGSTKKIVKNVSIIDPLELPSARCFFNFFGHSLENFKFSDRYLTSSVKIDATANSRLTNIQSWHTMKTLSADTTMLEAILSDFQVGRKVKILNDSNYGLNINLGFGPDSIARTVYGYPMIGRTTLSTKSLGGYLILEAIDAFKLRIVEKVGQWNGIDFITQPISLSALPTNTTKSYDFVVNGLAVGMNVNATVNFLLDGSILRAEVIALNTVRISHINTTQTQISEKIGVVYLTVN